MLDVTFPLFTIWSKLEAIPEILLPSPYKYPATTFPVTVVFPLTVNSPPTSTFAVVTNPVVALFNWMVSDVTFPLFEISFKLAAIPLN